MTKTLQLNCSVEAVSRLSRKDARVLLTASPGSQGYINCLLNGPDTVTVTLDYPLENPVSFRVNLGPLLPTVGDLLWHVARKYREIYKNPKAFGTGIWGHDLRDLWFETAKIDLPKGTVMFSVGS